MVLLWYLLFAAVANSSATTVVQGIRIPITSLDPFSIDGIEAYSATNNILEPLARSNPLTGEIVPVLAESWSLNPGKRTFHVKLKKNVKFHNDQPLTASDVQFTFEAYFDPAYRAQMWQGMWSEIESVKATGPLTVEFKMKRWRYQTFETAMTSLRVLPKSFYHPADRNRFRDKIIGSGPFQVKTFTSHRQLTLEPFKKWWGGQIPKHDLLFKTVGSAELAKQLLLKKELDFYPLRAEKTPAVRANSFHLRRVRSGLGHGFWLDLNAKLPIFQSAKVREVLQLIWHREELNRKVFSGKMELALDIFSPNTEIYPPGRAIIPDLTKAKQLLLSDGWQDKDKDSVLEKDGKPFEFNVLVNSADHERWATLFQRDAVRAGIKVTITRVEEDGHWLKRLQEGKFEAFAGGGGLLNEPTSLAWHTNGPYNYIKFSHAEVDRLTTELESEFDLKKRRLKLRKLIQIIREERPQIPGLMMKDEIYMTSVRLKVDSHHPARAWLWQVD